MQQQPTRLSYLANYEYAVNKLTKPLVETTTNNQRGVLLWGLPDSGKSTLALRLFSGRNYYDKDPMTSTLDGYQG